MTCARRSAQDSVADMVGEDYIEIAFRAAREADPAALLTYNEYGLEQGTTTIRQQAPSRLLLLLRRLKGAQCADRCAGHTVASSGGVAYRAGRRDTSAWRTSSCRCASLDCRSSLRRWTSPTQRSTAHSATANRAVAATYNDYLHVVLADKAVTAVLTWGISGRHTWLTQDKPRLTGVSQPLPFDTAYNALPAFYAIRDAYDGRLESLAHPPDATVNPYAPFTTARADPGAEGRARCEGEGAGAGQEAGPAATAPASSLPAIPTTSK